MQRPMIAAERTGRRCCAVELDPVYCDVAVRRWELATGRKANKDSRNEETIRKEKRPK